MNDSGSGINVLETPIRDCRWRTFVGRAVFKETAGQRIDSMRYDNFKVSVNEAALHEVYTDSWELQRRYQERDKIGTVRSATLRKDRQ